MRILQYLLIIVFLISINGCNNNQESSKGNIQESSKENIQQLPKEFFGKFVGVKESSNLMVNGASMGVVPECKYTFQLMDGNKIIVIENCVDDLPTEMIGKYNIISENDNWYYLDYSTKTIDGEMTFNGNLSINKDNKTGKQTSLDPEFEIIKE